MDRFLKIKRLHISILARKPGDLEKQRARVAKNVRAYFARKKVAGLCDRCGDVVAEIQYVHKGNIFYSRKARYCPIHWSRNMIVAKSVSSTRK